MKVSRILTYVLVFLVLLIAVPLITALFVEKEFQVERTVHIERPVDEVFNYIKYVQNHDNFTKWNTLDPDLNKSYSGIDGTVGFVYAWTGNEDAGSGEQEIVAIEEGRRVDHELRFKEPFEATARAWMVTEAAGEDRTELTWAMESSFPYPMNLLLLFIDMNESIGEDYEYGLKNLKAILETEIEIQHDAYLDE
ncbi:MAG: SRPBCC family protein [Balneolia bacterium]|nr:SRPBCC family protein [Balneolia bacterium]